jgi:hypothetical protein
LLCFLLTNVISKDSEMKFLILFTFIFTTIASSTFAGYVSGYTKKNGTYVDGYYRSDRNSTVTDNYSYKGNSNPYNNNVGTNKYKNDSSSPFYSCNRILDPDC